MQIIGDPIGTVEVRVLTSQTHTYKHGRVWYVTKDFSRIKKISVGFLCLIKIINLWMGASLLALAKSIYYLINI